MTPLHTKTYIFTLIVTLVIFVLAFLISIHFTQIKTENLRMTEDKIAVDILALETQYQLLSDSSCKTFDPSGLREQLDTLSSKLEFIEGQVGTSDPGLIRLRNYYSLLEIRHYLLSKRMSEECNTNKIFILYFYATKDCPQCQIQHYFIRAMRDRYREVEAYTFDYHLDLPAVRTLITLHDIPPEPPILDINGKVYNGFKSLEEIEAVVKPLLATSTPANPKNTRRSSK
jgi:hypothetical protein